MSGFLKEWTELINSGVTVCFCVHAYVHLSAAYDYSSWALLLKVHHVSAT
jgi:hypothetical protein